MRYQRKTKFISKISELIQHHFITQANVTHGRERLLEVIRQGAEIKKRKFSKQTKNYESISKRSSDSDSGKIFIHLITS